LTIFRTVVGCSHAKPPRSRHRLGPRNRSGPSLRRCVNGVDEGDEAAAREKFGEKFPKLIFHQIVCIGARIACDRLDAIAKAVAWTDEQGVPVWSERSARRAASRADRSALFATAIIRSASAPTTLRRRVLACGWPSQSVALFAHQ